MTCEVCGEVAVSPRAKFCLECFQSKAASSGRKSRGNASASGKIGNAANARGSGSTGNDGNASARGKTGNAGNALGNIGNAGNALGNIGNAGNASGSSGHAGNTRRGRVKKQSGKRGGQRSGIRRSAKRALVVKKEWIDLILSGRKTWEIRGNATTRRGWIHFAESKAGGKLVGRARLLDCIPLVGKQWRQKNFCRHRVSKQVVLPYKRPHAWVLGEAERFLKPFKYDHKQGAVIWVDV